TLPVQTTNTTPPASGQPSACVAGQMLLQVNGAPGQQLFICNSALDGWVMVNDDAASSAADHSYTDSQITIEVAARSAADSAETTRATGAESTITSNLNAEISRATAAEATKADLVKPVQLDNAAAVNGSCTAVNALVLNPAEPSGQQLFICRDIGGGTLQWQLINDDAATTAADHTYTDQQ